MYRITTFLILVLLFSFGSTVNATSYPDGTLLRAEGDIKVYLVNDNIKRWVSSLEVFDSYNFSWKNVRVVSRKEVAAIQEGELIPVSPTPTLLPEAVEATPVPAHAAPEASARRAKINRTLPIPDYIRADWLISHATANYGRVGQRIVFKYSSKEKDKIENFNLYEI